MNKYTYNAYEKKEPIERNVCVGCMVLCNLNKVSLDEMDQVQKVDKPFRLI